MRFGAVSDDFKCVATARASSNRKELLAEGVLVHPVEKPSNPLVVAPKLAHAQNAVHSIASLPIPHVPLRAACIQSRPRAMKMVHRVSAQSTFSHLRVCITDNFG